MVTNLLIVGVSGFFGSIARYSVYLFFSSKQWTTFPWATLFVNVLGCLLIGFGGNLVEQAVLHHRQILLIGCVGFLGAFTTFSAFGFETIQFIRSQQFHLAMANVLANLSLGFVAVILGIRCAHLYTKL